MNRQILTALAIVLMVGAVGVYMDLSHNSQHSHDNMSFSAAKSAPEKQVLFYRNPMNPDITSPVPAKDSMGMDYIPVYADGEGDDGPAGTVSIDPVSVQNIGVRTAIVERRNLTRDIRTVGRVDYDEKRVARLHPKTEGWIEQLMVDATGVQVKKDTILLGLYSPELVSTQEEYLLALANRERLTDAPYPDILEGALKLVSSTRQRLRLFDVPEHQIAELERTRTIKKTLHIHSPFDGVVVNVGARQGEYVTPKTELYTIADLSNVWVYVDVYEADLPWVRQGDHAEMTMASAPGKVFGGLITYIYPYMDPSTRTAKVRLEFPNPDLLLKPDMFVDVAVHADLQVDAVVIPSEAVVRSGAKNQVFVVRGPGKFYPREVRLGISADGWVQVLEGLEPGMEVVTSAQFLIDSESKLNEATAKMLEAMGSADTGDATAPKDDMGTMKDHDMGAMKDHDMGTMAGHRMGVAP